MTQEHDGGGPAESEGPSILDFLPASLRTRLTMERLALAREISRQAEGRERAETFIRNWIERVGDGRETEGWVAEFLDEARAVLALTIPARKPQAKEE